MTDEPNLSARILDYLASHPDSTTIEIARGIDADHWDVQLVICRMIWFNQVTQKRVPVRPIYRLAGQQGELNG